MAGKPRRPDAAGASDLPDALDAAETTETSDAADTADTTEWRHCVIGASLHGARLDKALVSLAPEFSRNHVQSLLEAGHCLIDEQSAGLASRRVRAGQRLALELVPTAQSLAFKPEPVPVDVVFEDAHILVVNKPAGLVVHPGAGNWSGTLLNGLLARDPQAASLPRAGIVHRLDKDTSGLMVVGRSLAAVTALVRAISLHEVHREYAALTQGWVTPAQQSVQAPIGRDPVSRVRMAVVHGGRDARTDVECLAHAVDPVTSLGLSAIRCTLHTGRTHQIRVHLAHLGHPLVADAVYGGKPALGLTRQALHAVRLAFQHPITGVRLSFDAALPNDLAPAFEAVLKGAAV